MKIKKILTALPLGLALYLSSILCSFAAGNIPKVEIFDKPAMFSRAPLNINGRLLVPGNDFISLIGGQISRFDPKESIEFVKDNKKVDMFFGSNIAYVNEKSIHMDVEPLLVDGRVMVPIRTLADLFNLRVDWFPKTSTVSIGGNGQIFSKIYNSPSTGKAYKVVIDAGHGGAEPGAIVGNVMEKDLNLDISKRVESILKSRGIKTFMTRTDDSYVGLIERTNYANGINADLFVSIHNNADYSAVNGSMTLYHPNFSSTSKNGYNTYIAAANVQRALTNELGTKDLGLIERPNLAVLRTSNMPAILVEVGYMTNRTELRKLLTSDFRQNAATAICDGIMETLK